MQNNFEEQFNLKIDAGIPVLQIVSYEWRRVLGFSVKASLREQSRRALFWWNKASAIKKWDEIENTLKRQEDKDIPQLALKWFREGMPDNSILVMEDLHLFLRTQPELLIDEVRECARVHPARKKTLVISTPFPIMPPELEKDVYVMEIPLPDQGILKTVMKEVKKELEEDGRKLEIIQRDENTVAEAALGLTEIEAKNTFKEIGIVKKRLSKDEIPLIITQKEQIIRKSGILEYFHPRDKMDDVGGMENLKEWLEQQRRAFEPDAADFGIDAPKGVLLLGIPGCGKSLIAKAIGNSWNYPLLKFDLGRVFGGIVGQSEQNIRKALEVANAIAPCILWIDEIEKGLSGVKSSNELDAGVSARVFGTLLTWMQEKDTPVFVVATANDISQLPPEFLRKGRFNEIFFVDLPGHKSREEIWKIHFKRRLKGRLKGLDLDYLNLISASCFYSGSEIEEAVNTGLLEAYNKDREVETHDLLESLKNIYPLSRTMAEDIKKMRSWAEIRVRIASKERPEDFSEVNLGPRLKQEMLSSPFT